MGLARSSYSTADTVLRPVIRGLWVVVRIQCKRVNNAADPSRAAVDAGSVHRQLTFILYSTVAVAKQIASAVFNVHLRKQPRL